MRQLSGYTFDVPVDWYALPVDDNSSAHEFARSLLQEVAPAVPASDNTTAFVADVEDIVTRLRLETGGAASAAALVRTTGGPRLAAIVTHLVHDLDDDDTPESYEAFTRQALNRSIPGNRSLEADTWQLECAAGRVVGARHVAQRSEPGNDEQWAEQRTIFAVFVTGTRQMIQFTFITSDFMAFSDMASETWSLVATVRPDLEAAA
jgi:hypothetical protein